MNVGRSSAVRPRPGLLHRELDGETVLLDPDAGTYYGLNEVGTTVWRALQVSDDPRPLEEVHAELLREYDVDVEELWTDLVALVDELAQRGLVDVVR